MKTDGGPNLIELTQRFSTADLARAYLESILWPAGPTCPHCGVVNEATKLAGASTRPGVFKCRPCRKQFSVTVGTIFEDSKIPLNKWVIAYHLLCANKKGISSLSLSRMLGISYKSAWFMTHRIRHAMHDTSTDPLTGIVEADETFVGGKAKNAHSGKPIPVKTPVVALVERNGKVKARTVTSVTAATVGPMLKRMVAQSAILMTDDARIYIETGKHFAQHLSVNHSASEYVRAEPGVKAHTQTVESFNALIKRSVVGAWHSVSPEHLGRYVDECAFRWNTRTVSDGERMEQAMQQSAGRRLTYRKLGGKS